ncbi:AMP-binding protein [Nocardioides sp. L-11A]|uniref:AMP-binding protein n=1 Tax=Nocardioides sp. L-11A TaxID=3043848 RepID=UPI00249A348A|nr:AMP-binding protein [Nocardioides sp. L-11A]
MTDSTRPTALEARWGPTSAWNVGTQLRRQAVERPRAPYVAVGDAPALAFAEVAAEAERTAGRFWSLGLRAGDRVLFFLPTCGEAVHGWLGAKLLGLVDIPLNDAFRGESLAHAVNLSGARVIVLSRALAPELAQVRDRITGDLAVVVAEDLDELPVATDWEPAAPAHSDLSTVLLTSGTTGPAKGVMMTNAQTHAIARECAEGLRMGAEDVFYCFHPLFHMAGRFGALYAALITGARVCLDVGFAPERWIDRIRACGATVTIAHGPMIEMVHATERRPDDATTALRAVLAAPLPAAIGADFEERFGVVALETWGMTEVTACCWRPYDAPLRLGAAGRPLDELVEITVVDPVTDEPLPAGQVGEITVRPRHPWLLMQGYLGMPEETVRAWRNLRFHSGDAGFLDDDGWLHFVDRLGDRIRRKAENISSYDIEVAAGSHPGVTEAAAVGVPVTPSDDEIKLVVATRGSFDPEALFRHLVAELPHHMVPRYVERLDALPRTPTNKVRKRELRERGVTSGTWDYKAAGLSIRTLRGSTDHTGQRPTAAAKGSTA